mmetsp:Transcript_59574/g.98770  ORF Transcript_59574/g.98770 Transcript_59574/m.98770 type:complete len:231 (+) Transcript_59574:1606-2298(+)
MAVNSGPIELPEPWSLIMLTFTAKPQIVLHCFTRIRDVGPGPSVNLVVNHDAPQAAVDLALGVVLKLHVVPSLRLDLRAHLLPPYNCVHRDVRADQGDCKTTLCHDVGCQCTLVDNPLPHRCIVGPKTREDLEALSVPGQSLAASIPPLVRVGGEAMASGSLPIPLSLVAQPHIQHPSAKVCTIGVALKRSRLHLQIIVLICHFANHCRVRHCAHAGHWLVSITQTTCVL